MKYAVQCPTHEPSTIVPIITTATEHLGVGVTLSTAFEHPYSMVRRRSSLDHLSNGRVAWNIVSSYSKSECAIRVYPTTSMGPTLLPPIDDRTDQSSPFFTRDAAWSARRDPSPTTRADNTS